MTFPLPTRSPRARWIALPVLVAGLLLLLISGYVFGSMVRTGVYTLMSFFRPGIYAELLIVLYFSLLVSAFQRRPAVGATLLSLLIVAYYLAALGKWLVLNESLSMSDIGSVDELLRTLPFAWAIVLGMAITGVALVFAWNARRPSLIQGAALVAPLALYGAMVMGAPTLLIAALDTVRPDIFWRPDQRIWRNGPIFSLAREWPDRVRIRTRLNTASASGQGAPGTINSTALPAQPAWRNLHIVQEESFIDPMNFRGVSFPVDPIDSRLRRWMNESHSLALSATFGGQSSRAEFEVLCGVPSYMTLGVEFNLLRGTAIPCLPDVLRQRGYVTIANVASSASFFNVGRAYRGIGFEHRFFAPNFAFDDMDGLWLSDASMFRQSLAHVDALETEGRPVLSYVVTGSGHEPFDLNPVARPARFPGENWIARSANAAHYKSQAVADYVELVEARDPDAVIVIMGDHLPPFGLSNEEFGQGDYRLRHNAETDAHEWALDSLVSRGTLLVVRKAGQTVPVGLVPQFAMAETVLDLLTDGAYCRATTCTSGREVIYRPRNSEPRFTTRSGFPAQVCEQEGTGSRECDEAWRLHHRLRAAYDALLAKGIQRATP